MTTVNQKFGITLLIFTTASLLAACNNAVAPNLVMERLNQRYAGKPVGEFFRNYGRPVGKPRAADDGETYVWATIQPDNKPAGVPGVHVSPNAQITFPSSAAKAPGGLICQLTIQTDTKGAIRNFAIVHDSEGKRSNSRCSEIFN